MATSYPDRTSPVLRGAWIMEHLLGTPPTPPPPGRRNEPDSGVARATEVGPRAAAAASHRVIVQPLSRRHRSARPGARELQRDRRMAHARARQRCRDRPDRPSSRTAARQQPGRFAAGARGGARKVRANGLRTCLPMRSGVRVEYYDMPVVRAIVHDAARSDYSFASIVDQAWPPALRSACARRPSRRTARRSRHRATRFELAQAAT